MRLSAFLGIPLAIALIAFLYSKIFPLSSLRTNPPPLKHRLFSVEELSLYNGSDPQQPIYLGILGTVFDVTKGKSHYGSGGGYNHFAGRDASRAFVSGNFTDFQNSEKEFVEYQNDLNTSEELIRYFECLSILNSGDGLTDSLHGLSSSEVKSVVEWRDFYFRTYIYIGKLVGRYYNSEGNPSKYLKGVEAKAARGAQLLEKQKNEEAKVPSCNSRWSQNEGSEVWCDDGYPRLVQRPVEIALTGKMSKRCACYKEDELEQAGLEVYEGCDYFAKKCRL